MPVAFLLGLDKDKKFPIKVLLKPEQLIYVGLRDIDPFEKNQVKIKKRSTIDEYVSMWGEDQKKSTINIRKKEKKIDK
jgi:arginase family enzyme